MMRACGQIIFRDLRLALRQGLDAVMVLMFFVITVTLFPIGVGPEPNLLARMGPGVIWVAALLSSMLSLDRLFQHDYEDGSLELLVLSPVPLEALVLAKVVAHWLLTGLPLIVAAPLLATFMNMPSEGLLVLMASMLLGTPVSSFIGAVGGALTLGARRGGVLVSLLVLPLYIPLLIFGVAAVDAAIDGLLVKPHLLFLGAMLAAAIPLATWAAAAALRQACE
jgi:heme exporter protein B